MDQALLGASFQSIPTIVNNKKDYKENLFLQSYLCNL